MHVASLSEDLLTLLLVLGIQLCNSPSSPTELIKIPTGVTTKGGGASAVILTFTLQSVLMRLKQECKEVAGYRAKTGSEDLRSKSSRARIMRAIAAGPRPT